MALSDRRGRFKIHEDVILSNDPMVDVFFRTVRVYEARNKDEVIHYKGVSAAFDEISADEPEPSYDLYVDGGKLVAERNDF